MELSRSGRSGSGWSERLRARLAGARSGDVLPLRIRAEQLGAAFVGVCALLVVATWGLVESEAHGWLLPVVCEIASVALAGGALLLPWARLPRVTSLLFPLLALVPLALLPFTADSYATAYNNMFTMAAAFAGVTQRRTVAVVLGPAMLPLYVVANGVQEGLYVRLPVALTTWLVVALVLSDLMSKHVASEAGLRRENAEVRERSRSDALTGLPNREVLEEQLDLALARGRLDGSCCAVFFCDVDGFKDINDAWGHLVGDRVLVEIAAVLTRQLGPDDIVCRVGGDEFVLVANEVGSVADAEELGGRLTRVLNTEHVVDGRAVLLAASVGIAVIETARGDGAGPSVDPSGPISAARAVAAADRAMYDAKQAGGGLCRVWDEASAAAHDRRTRMTADLRRALHEDEGQLWVAYQPIVDLATSEPIGVEALARWDHPGQGMIPPDLFIAAAEAGGCIGDLGRRVLDLAVAQTARWNEQRERGGATPLWVSVNCSPRQLQHPGFVDDVRAALHRSGLPAESLVLEITESALLEGTQLVTRRLQELRHLGVTLALDDFGTGYSSLSYLRHLPTRMIKIDRSFVAGLGSVAADEAVVAAVTGIAVELGQIVLAEGIETVQQAEVARGLGCVYGQGYLFARPQRPAALELAPAASWA